MDADGDGCDTRREVLIAEAVTAPTIGAGCALSGGRWRSVYDNATETGSGRGFDVDHLVPLAEAWESGAWAGRATIASATPTISATTMPWSLYRPDRTVRRGP